MDFKPLPPGPVRWGTMIPLIGGSAIGCSRATLSQPLFHLSYQEFAANEVHLMNYWPDVPTFWLNNFDDDVPPKLLEILDAGEIDFVNSVSLQSTTKSLINTIQS